MVFTLFVNNVPPKVHWRWLRRVFQSFGNVVDVFIPRKRNKLGSKMGFVRFESILEARNAQRQLNGAWFLDYRIWVNLAKYNPRRSFWRKTGVFHKEAMVTGAEKVSQLQSMKQNQSFTNDTRRSYSKVLLEGVTDQRKQQYASMDVEDRSGDNSKATCAREVDSEPGCKGVFVAENLHWLERSVIGKLKGDLEFDTVLNDIDNTDCRGVVIRKFSGNEYIITMENYSVFERWEKTNWNLLDSWFEDITKWTVDRHRINRTVWVACYGIPIQAWCLETFQNIAERWGEFLRMDSVTLDFISFNKGCLQVITNLQSKIDEFFSLQVGNLIFNVKAVEINHDCEFTGPCCYEELNFALRKVGLTRKDLQGSEGEEDDDGEETEQVKNTEEGYQECTVKGDTTPVNVGLHQIVCMGNSNIEVVSRHVINSDINSVNSIDPLVANKESNENAGANPIVLNLETSIGNTMEIDKESTVVGLEKAILDYDQCEKGLETNVLAGGPGEFVKPANLNEAERDVCLDLDNTDNGPQGMILTTRAEEDVSLMGLGPYVSNVQENADLIVESAPIAESGVDTEREEGDDTEIDNHKVSKKWRCVDDVNKELSRKVNKKGKKHKKKFERKVYSSRSFATSRSIANQSRSSSSSSFSSIFLCDIKRKGKVKRLKTKGCGSETNLGRASMAPQFMVGNSAGPGVIEQGEIGTVVDENKERVGEEIEENETEVARKIWKVGQLVGLKAINEEAIIAELASRVREEKAR